MKFKKELGKWEILVAVNRKCSKSSATNTSKQSPDTSYKVTKLPPGKRTHQQKPFGRSYPERKSLKSSQTLTPVKRNSKPIHKAPKVRRSKRINLDHYPKR